MKNLLIVLFVSVALFSCRQKTIYSDYKRLSGSEWHQDSVLQFDMTVPDSTKVYTLYFNVRNEGRYPFSNLYLFVRTIPPRGKVLNDTIELTLASPDGKWFGYGLGGLYDMKYPYKQSVFFPVPGYYRFEVRQGMRSENGYLKGIHDFGMTLDRLN